MKRIAVILPLCFIFLFPVQVKAQIVINEFLASNSGMNIDPDFNESGDWMELYNTGTSSFSIGGYYLSDNFGDKIKWKIPAGIRIESGGFLLIWADGHNTGLHTSFKISASGEELAIYSPSGDVIDSVSFGLQNPNVSMGRKSDGNTEWSLFTNPTPGATNNAETFDGIVRNVPQFSLLGGIFNAPVTVEITNTLGGTIHYTLDGSEPDNSSPVVNGAFFINKTTIIRARILKPNWIPGEVITHTYFIDTKNEIGNLPVVSISTDPENFWDSQKGIYVQDFKPDWEIPINIELFENDGSDRAGFNLTAGAKVNGLYSWQLPQKMLGIYFRKSYGKGKLDYPLLFDHDRKIFDSFALRASGSDWAFTLFRDGMAQSLSQENMDVDFQGFRACVVYINGQYMGIHNIRSKVDEDFIVENHQLGDQKIDMVENENYAEAGTLDRYALFESQYKRDLSVQANFDAVAAQMDIENFTDFIITEIYSQNTSVDHNIMAWKPQLSGKWKWILNDLDRGFFKPGNNMISFYANKHVIPLKQLLLNNSYRKYFGLRMANHLFTTFDPERVKAIIDEFSNNIKDEIPSHIQRWQGTSSDYGNPISSVNYWNAEVEKMKTFADSRPTALLNDLQNYGFARSEPLSISIFPENAGTINFNGIKIKQAFSQGAYPLNEEISLTAESKGGFNFKGWTRAEATLIVAKEQVWKYNDTGNTIASNWTTADFNDAGWRQGQAELGYGDGDEKTVVSYGGVSNNKIITTYFRKTFLLESLGNVKNLKISLKCDDGAVVYLNGTEVARENLPSGEIGRLTKALTAVGGSSESDFTIYSVDAGLLKTGNNTIAVEVHQAKSTSSDISFDLELSAAIASSNAFVSTNPNYSFTHTGNIDLLAVFESDGSCILPEEITTETILNKNCSPYRVPNNVLVAPSGKLIIEPGVELWISDNVSIKVNGMVKANGTVDEPVILRSNPNSKNQKWGILNFVNADTSYLNNIVIEDASKGFHPQREIAAVSAFHSVLKINGAVIENVYENPVIGRYSDISMINSRLHSEVVGDLINVKYGKGIVDNCTFTGNDDPDTDAVDFDDVENGVIKNSVIHDFNGFNSDAIDIGERAKNIAIENVFVYNITDKGVSVGQQSSATISNSIFVNCNLGAGLKDSSRVSIDHCTYYGNGTSIACYEKNAGDAGGNAVVTNSILSNAYDATYSSDAMSTINISYSASDNDVLPAGKNNLFTNPRFLNPNLFDFRLSTSSTCVAAGNNGDMGANLQIDRNINQLFISRIAYKSNLVSEVNEFIVLTNSGIVDFDISGYEFTKGITFKFPDNTFLKAGKDVYISNNSGSTFWFGRGLTVYQWESGRLADEGETIQLQTSQGIVVDRVQYNNNTTWPKVNNGEGILLISNKLDNHFGSNWKVAKLNLLVNVKNLVANGTNLKFYPNPTTGIVHISGLGTMEWILNVYNISGVKVKSQVINASHSQVDLENLEQGVYVVRCGDLSQRVILLK